MALEPAGLILGLTAGVVTFFSPCGLPMLPAYISYHFGVGDARHTASSADDGQLTLRRGLMGGAAGSFGFLTVLLFVGVITASIGGVVARYAVMLEPVVGGVLVGMGGAMLFDVDLAPRFGFTVRQTGGLRGLYLFGVLYAVAAVSCSMPVFISIMVYTATRGGFFDALAVFLLYALGMSSLLIVLTVLVSQAKKATAQKLRKAIPVVRRVGALGLVTVGAYLILYYIHIWF